MDDKTEEICKRLRFAATPYTGHSDLREAADLIETQSARIAILERERDEAFAAEDKIQELHDKLATRIQQQALEYITLFDQCSEAWERVKALEEQLAEAKQGEPINAHELWAAAQLAPGEAIEDGVARIEAMLTAAAASEDKRDAARYRWLRKNGGYLSIAGYPDYYDRKVDEFIDAEKEAEMTQAYTEGRIAFEDNKEIIDNPYPELSGDWHDWRKGWLDASEDDWDRRKS
jgi:hypothetical protein